MHVGTFSATSLSGYQLPSYSLIKEPSDQQWPGHVVTSATTRLLLLHHKMYPHLVSRSWRGAEMSRMVEVIPHGEEVVWWCWQASRSYQGWWMMRVAKCGYADLKKVVAVSTGKMWVHPRWAYPRGAIGVKSWVTGLSLKPDLFIYPGESPGGLVQGSCG